MPWDHVRDAMDKLLVGIPFVASINGRPALNYTRIIEALIIAVVAGGLSGYIAVQKLELRMDMIEKKVEKVFNDIYRPRIPAER